MARETVRMGGGGSSPPWKLIAIAIGAGAVVALVVVFVPWSDEAEQRHRPKGCQGDADCKAGSVCLGRGCLILLSSEQCNFRCTYCYEKFELGRMQAPVVRVTGFDVIVPLMKLENHYLPGPERILRGMKKAMTF